MPKIGETAPDFELLNQDGKSVHLSDFRGKKVVLFAYPKAGTPGCTKQACGFRDAFPKLESTNVVVLGISPDKPSDQLKWKKKEKLPYDLLADTEHRVLEQWGAWGEKSLYGKKYFGVIRSHWVIDEHGVVIDEQLNVKPEVSVAEAVKTLGA
ncbi:MAG: thioredoxin-dependent thiol peroxidase [Chloroflexi bacterium]|nr:thioredoxin-dependent thiol peroxidase [Chloroflexota bacterium]